MTNMFKILPERKKSMNGYFNIVGVCKCKHADYEHQHTDDYSKRLYCKNCICNKYHEISRMRQDQYFELENSRTLRLHRLEQRLETKEIEENEVPVNFRAFIFYAHLTYKLINTNRLLRPFFIFYYDIMNLKDFTL